MLLAFRRNDAEATAQGRDRDPLRWPQERADDELLVRSEILGTAGDLLMGDDLAARDRLLTLVHDAAARLFDETASTGWSQLAAIDVEHRRFRDAESLLEQSLPFTVDRDIPICEQWQTGVRSRLQFERGRWEAGLEDARTVLDGGAPIASLWPHLVAGLVALRRGEEPERAHDHLEQAWELAEQMAEPLARLAVLAAVAERAWLLDTDDAAARPGPTPCCVRSGRSRGCSGRRDTSPCGCGGSGRDPGRGRRSSPSRSRSSSEGRPELRPPSSGVSLGAPYERALARSSRPTSRWPSGPSPTSR